MNLVEGARCSETVNGTNGVGTALATGHPGAGVAESASATTTANRVCSGAPIHDRVSGRLVGVMDALRAPGGSPTLEAWSSWPVRRGRRSDACWRAGATMTPVFGVATAISRRRPAICSSTERATCLSASTWRARSHSTFPRTVARSPWATDRSPWRSRWVGAGLESAGQAHVAAGQYGARRSNGPKSALGTQEASCPSRARDPESAGEVESGS